jgi:hypothetical protein
VECREVVRLPEEVQKKLRSQQPVVRNVFRKGRIEGKINILSEL